MVTTDDPSFPYFRLRDWENAFSRSSDLVSLDHPDFMQDLEEAIRRRRFTPIVGDECSAIGRPAMDAWRNDLIDRFEHILYDPRLDDATDRPYVFSLADSTGVRLKSSRDFRRPWHHQPTDIPERDVDNPQSKSIHDLRVLLVKLVTHLHTTYARGMYSTYDVVRDAVQHPIRIRSIADDLRDHLVLACLAAGEVRDAWGRHPLGGVWRNVYDRLRELAFGLLSWDEVRRATESLRYWTEFELQFDTLFVAPSQGDEVRAREDAAKLYNDAKSTVTLGHLKWLGDLIWYTFRFDLPIFPTNRELAFVVGLSSVRPYNQTDLITRAEHNPETTVERARTWFSFVAERGVGLPDEAMQFYGTLARYAWYQRTNSRFAPLVISTNVHDALERQLAAHLGCCGVKSGEAPAYHVVLPVEVRAEGEDRDGAPDGVRRWVRWIVESHDGCERRLRVLHPDDHSTGAPTPRLDGPVVLKLNGAPLHRFPSGALQRVLQAEGEFPSDANDDWPWKVHPLFSLRESSHIRNIVLLSKSFPAEVSRLIGSPAGRFIAFLGCSVDDWYVRVGLANYLFTQPEPNRRTLVAINRQFDEDRSAVLPIMGIKRWRAPLTELTSIIEEILDG